MQMPKKQGKRVLTVSKKMKIHLVSPEEGAITDPLQKFYLSMEEEPGTGDFASHAQGPAGKDAPNSLPQDRSLPAPVVFRWRTDPAAGGSINYRILLSGCSGSAHEQCLQNITGNRAEVLHLHAATRYRWRVEAYCNGQKQAESPIGAFTTNGALPRWISVPGITNVRDIGGWKLPRNKRVRQGMVYRSSEMNCHLAITEEGSRVLLDELGIKTDLDIRAEEPYPALDMNRADWVNIPVRPYGEIFCPEQQESYRRIFELFAEQGRYPVLFHCWGGADRAGTLAFLLNGLLGVRLEDLAHDYELTTLSIWGPRSRQSPEFAGILEGLSEYAPSESIHIQIEKYLLSAGLNPGCIGTIREILNKSISE